MLSKISFDLTINLDKNYVVNIENLKEFLKVKDLIPNSIKPSIYVDCFATERSFTKHKTLTLKALTTSVETKKVDDLGMKILEKFKQIVVGIQSIINFKQLKINYKNKFEVFWGGLKFFVFNNDAKIKKFLPKEIKSKLIMKGHIDSSVVNKFQEKDFVEIQKQIILLGGGPINADKISIGKLNDEIKPNFLFIRSLMDFINSAPSESFSRAFLAISERVPFLFKPNDKFWDDLLSKDEDEQIKILFPLINQARGLTRADFNQFISYWINIIKFLREKCSGSARNFFVMCCDNLGINIDDPLALEKLQSLLETFTEIKEYLDIYFPFSFKAGRLMFTMMTKNQRGFDLMNGVTIEHQKNFNLPVDAQLLRVCLNTGLLKIDYVKTVNKELEGKSADILLLRRSDMTEIVQKAWKQVSDKMKTTPTELDYLIYSLGSLICNRFGKNCYCCPITSKCDSWNRKSVFEGEGVRWNKNGGFSYAKGKKDALIFRTCDSSGKPMACINTFHPVVTFDSEDGKINLKKFIEKYS